MSFADELRNTPRDTQNAISPQERELQNVPPVNILIDCIKKRCNIEQRSGRNQFQGMLYNVWKQESDNDGGYMNMQWGVDFRPDIVGKQKLTEKAIEYANQYEYYPKYYPGTQEYSFSVMDVANKMAREGEADHYNGGGPIFYQYRETAVKLRDALRDEIEKLGFDRNGVIAIEVSDFRIKSKIKTYQEFITHKIKFEREVGKLEFTGEFVYSIMIKLQW